MMSCCNSSVLRRTLNVMEMFLVVKTVFNTGQQKSKRYKKLSACGGKHLIPTKSHMPKLKSEFLQHVWFWSYVNL